MTTGGEMARVIWVNRAWRTPWGRGVTASLAIGLLSACGTSNSDSPSAASSPIAAAAAAAKPAGTNVGVTEKEFSITLDKASFSPGAYTFAIKNQGQYPHNLKISGPGVSSAASPVMTGGKSGSLTAPLQTGSYQLWCGVPRHNAEGIVTTITVA